MARNGWPGGLAPVSYRDLRRRFRIGRIAAAAILGALALTGVGSAPTPSVIMASGFALIAADAAIFGRNRRSALAAVFLDAIVLGLVAGAGTEAGTALVGAVAYIVTTAVLLLSKRPMVGLLGILAGLVALRVAVLDPIVFGAPRSTVSGAVEAGVYMVAATMVLVSAAHALQIARSRQAAALTAERRASEIKNEFVAMITHRAAHAPHYDHRVRHHPRRRMEPART